MRFETKSLLLPALIFVAVLTFSVRLGGVFVSVRDIVSQNAYAAAEPEAKDEAKAKAGAKDESAPSGKMDKGGGEDDHKDEHSGKADYSDGKGEELPVWRDAVEEDFAYANTRDSYTRALEDRRKVLGAREKEMRAREALLDAAEQEMERKYVELNQIRKQIEGLLGQQEEAEQKQITTLVKIYEGMKAKEAAVIFNTLDIDVLLRVLTAMSERKASAILAKMTPERAKTITVMLAEQKSLPELP